MLLQCLLLIVFEEAVYNTTPRADPSMNTQIPKSESAEKKGGLPAAGGATYVELWRRLIIQNIQLYLPTKLTRVQLRPHEYAHRLCVP